MPMVFQVEKGDITEALPNYYIMSQKYPQKSGGRTSG
jgi:hypothetical protein